MLLTAAIKQANSTDGAEGARGAREPEGAVRRRHEDLQQAVLRRPTTRRSTAKDYRWAHWKDGKLLSLQRRRDQVAHGRRLQASKPTSTRAPRRSEDPRAISRADLDGGAHVDSAAAGARQRTGGRRSLCAGRARLQHHLHDDEDTELLSRRVRLRRRVHRHDHAVAAAWQADQFPARGRRPCPCGSSCSRCARRGAGDRARSACCSTSWRCGRSPASRACPG